MPIYQVDAFADKIFEGNPAAICPLEEWISDEIMQNIAMENNLSETAFFVEEENSFRLRWFTPTNEVDLCGHATLATAHVIFEHLGYEESVIRFNTNSGKLEVQKQKERLVMDFPASELNETFVPRFLEDAIGIPAKKLYRDTDYLYVVKTAEQVRNLKPDIRALEKANVRGIIVTAPGGKVDFVSRFFAPSVGVDEDPVTGSAHTMLAPYWSRRFEKKELIGQQVSSRGGRVYCKDKDDRVELGGTACTYLKGEIEI